MANFFIVYPTPDSTILPKTHKLSRKRNFQHNLVELSFENEVEEGTDPLETVYSADRKRENQLLIDQFVVRFRNYYSDLMLATKCLDGKSSRSRGNSWRICSFADERQQQTDRGGESSSKIALDVSRWRDLGEDIPSRLTSLSSSWCVVQPVVRQWEKDKRERERRAAITGNHTVDMIISKDLFLFGDQDYLRLPSNEKRQQRAMGRPIINAPRWVVLSPIIWRHVHFFSDVFSRQWCRNIYWRLLETIGGFLLLDWRSFWFRMEQFFIVEGLEFLWSRYWELR